MVLLPRGAFRDAARRQRECKPATISCYMGRLSAVTSPTGTIHGSEVDAHKAIAVIGLEFDDEHKNLEPEAGNASSSALARSNITSGPGSTGDIEGV